MNVTPEAVVLDREGRVRYRGALDDNPDVARVRRRLVASVLDAVLAGKRVTAASNTPIGCLIETRAPVTSRAVTYASQVQPILKANCETCHHTGGSAPFPLTTYEQARSWSGMIRRVTQKRIMPPWKPAPHFGDLRGERRLTDAQIRTLARWADAGAPLGNPSLVRPARTWPVGWRLGPPDLLLQADRPYHLAADGNDVYRCYTFPAPVGGVHWVSASEVRVGNPAVVHHVLIYLDPEGKSAALDGKEAEPGYTSTGGGINVDDASILGGWAPGIEPSRLPAGTAFAVPPGARLVVQVHYHKDGQAETDRTSVGLHWAKGPVDRVMRLIPVLNPGMRLPAGGAHIPIHADQVIRADAHAYTVIPHMHLLGRTFQAVATRPDGTRIPLIRIPDWDFNWQAIYEFRKPVALPAGTRIDLDAVYDNSAGNPRNPNRPPKDVKWGEQTTDEMCLLFVGITLDAEHNVSRDVASAAGP